MRSDAAELVIVVALISLTLVGLILPKLGRVKGGPGPPSCTGNLRQLGTAFALWEDDHNGLRPMSVPAAEGGAMEAALRGDLVRMFQCISNELSTPAVVLCPEEGRTRATNFATLSVENLSYFLSESGDTNRPDRWLVGDHRMLIDGAAAKGGLVGMSRTNRFRWAKGIHHGLGNVLFSDRSVRPLKDESLNAYQEGLRTNVERLLFP